MAREAIIAQREPYIGTQYWAASSAPTPIIRPMVCMEAHGSRLDPIMWLSYNAYRQRVGSEQRPYEPYYLHYADVLHCDRLQPICCGPTIHNLEPHGGHSHLYIHLNTREPKKYT